MVSLSVFRSLYRVKSIRCSSGTANTTSDRKPNEDGKHHDYTSAPPGENDTCVPPGSERLNGDSEDDVRKRVFEASLHYVPKYGWSRRAIAAGYSYGFFFCTCRIKQMWNNCRIKARFHLCNAIVNFKFLVYV